MSHRDEHSPLEDLLDSLRPESFVATLARLLDHYAAEERAYPGPRFDKMRAQHEEVREIGREALASLAAGHPDDALRLLARFQALARHNMIEEERDVFPYYDKSI